MTSKPSQPPPAAGPEAGPAKPADPGPTDPPGIAKSVLPERKRDAARHADEAAGPPEAVERTNDVIAAEQAPVDGGRSDEDD